MPIRGKRKVFFVTADTNDVLSGDQVLGSCGRGTYRIFAAAAAAADATITINDGSADVISAAPIPVKAAAVTYPAISRTEDFYWEVTYQGNGQTIPINISDGTNAEITLVVEYLG